MIVVDKDKSIFISKGDVLDVGFNVKGIILDDSYQILFSVKVKTSDEQTILVHRVLNIDYETNSFRVIIPSSEMDALAVGKYFYDLVCIKDGNKRTLINPTYLIIKEVVHDD